MPGYLKELAGHDEGHAGAELPHGLQAQRHDLRPRPVVHKGVHQLPQHRCHDIRRHQLMTRLHASHASSGPRPLRLHKC